MASDTSTTGAQSAIQGSAPPGSPGEHRKQLGIYNAKLKQRTEDFEMLKGIWVRLPWLWSSLATMIPLGLILGVWGVFIGLGLALSLVGVGYYITYAHLSQHEMEIEDIRKRLALLQEASDQWVESPPPKPAGPPPTSSPVLL